MSKNPTPFARSRAAARTFVCSLTVCTTSPTTHRSFASPGGSSRTPPASGSAPDSLTSAAETSMSSAGRFLPATALPTAAPPSPPPPPPPAAACFENSPRHCGDRQATWHHPRSLAPSASPATKKSGGFLPVAEGSPPAATPGAVVAAAATAAAPARVTSEAPVPKY